MRYFLVLAFLLANSVLAADLPEGEERRMTYETWKLPSAFSLSRVERLLQTVVTRLHGKAFRYLGVDEDFFHGHLLFEETKTESGHRLTPRAILYHTQEEAHAAHWRGTVDKKYDYLDVTTRNWIQWLSDEEEKDGERLENARIYFQREQTNPRYDWHQFWKEGAEPEERFYYTVHDRRLDPQRLGFKVYGALQFEFYRTDCDSLGENPYGMWRGPIRVLLPNGKKTCLKVGARVPFFPND